MVVGLVAILVLFAGLLQIADLGFQHTNAMIAARTTAGQHAMGDTFISDAPGPQFIQDWNPGPDKKTHSADDQVIGIDPSTAVKMIVDPAKPDDLQAAVKGNQISALNTGSLIMGFDFVHGRQQSPNIQLTPIIRHIVYGTDTMRVQGDAWLVWSKGIN